MTLYLTPGRTTTVEIKEDGEIENENCNIGLMNIVTRRILLSFHEGRMKDTEPSTFPLLFVPANITDFEHWLAEMSGHVQGSSLPPSEHARGIVRDMKDHEKRYLLQGVDRHVDEISGAATTHLRCTRFPRRTDFLHPILSHDTLPQKPPGTILIDPTNCYVDRVPLECMQFARTVPSIMHRIELQLLACQLRETILAPVAFTDPELTLLAITTPQSREEGDYERLELLGDTVLKLLVSVTLMAIHLNWHEGYLTNWKDQIISNGRLAKAAETTGIVKYIISKQFTGAKWRPPYNESFMEPTTEPKSRPLSTKICADVCEALIGAAYIDGGLEKATRMLQLLIPELSFDSVQSQAAKLLRASATFNVPSTLQIQRLEQLLGHEFANKCILLESMTHASHISTSPIRCYDRLEFLGDALLDYIVCTTITRFSTKSPHGPLPVHRMHLLKTATVNASFLAYRALSVTLALPVKEVNTTVVRNPQGGRSTAHTSISTTEIHQTLPDFLRHTPDVSFRNNLVASRARFSALKPVLDAAFAQTIEPSSSPPSVKGGRVEYPWAALAAFSPDKSFSDLIESTLAAVWIDTEGSFEACEAFLRRFGILTWLDAALVQGMDGLNVWHPKEEVGALVSQMGGGFAAGKDAGTEKRGVRYDISRTETGVKEGNDGAIEDGGDEDLIYGQGRYTCRLVANNEAIATASGWSRVEVETAAAERAVKILRARRGVSIQEAMKLETTAVAQEPDAVQQLAQQTTEVPENELVLSDAVEVGNADVDAAPVCFPRSSLKRKAEQEWYFESGRQMQASNAGDGDGAEDGEDSEEDDEDDEEFVEIDGVEEGCATQ